MPHNRIELSAREMRELGYQVVDTIIEHFETLRSKAPAVTRPREALEPHFREPLPEQPAPAEDVVRHAVEHAFGNTIWPAWPKRASAARRPGRSSARRKWRSWPSVTPPAKT